MDHLYINEGKKILERFVESGELCGASFAFVTKDEYECDYVGYRSLLPGKIPNSIDTLYDLASLSKVVSTTVLALKLIEDGYVSLRTRVQSVLPDFPYEDITVFHLLTHSSGLPADDKNYKPKGNGFVFDNYDSNGLFWAMDQAMPFWSLPADVREAEVSRIMRESHKRFNHEACAREYIALYERMLNRHLVKDFAAS